MHPACAELADGKDPVLRVVSKDTRIRTAAVGLKHLIVTS